MKRTFNVAGLTFRFKHDPSLKQLRPEGEVNLVPEPDNKVDPDAIKVMLGDSHIGYVPRGHPVREFIAERTSFRAWVNGYSYFDKDAPEGEQFNEEHIGRLGSVTIAIEDEDQRPESKPRIIRSFNENVDIEFYELEHQYWYNGKRLQSVTTLLGACYPPFNKMMIAGRCADSWGMPADDIVDMWSRNGRNTASFGDAIHGALEVYQKYGHLVGEKALPKQPILRSIVETFPWNGSQGLTTHTEVLITCVARGVCGHADRVSEKENKLWVSDIKAQVEADKASSSHKCSVFPNLPNTKITKALLQSMMYAQMLEETGLTVGDKVAAYIYDGDWNTHVRDRIPNVLDTMINDKP